MNRPLGRMIAVASGKGGVGKTVVAAGLAQAFARRGERVLLFDGDLGMANVDVQLGLTPAADLGAVIAGRTPLDGAISPAMGGSIRASRGGFDVIAGRSGSGALAGVSAEQAGRLATALSAVSLSYDRVLMDLAAGAGPSLLRMAAAADDVLAVVTSEPTAMTDAYAFVKMLRMRDEGAAPMVAVNLAESRAHGERVHEGFAKTCRSFLDFDPAFAGPIRRDPAVPASVRRQQGLFEHAPDCKAAADITAMAAALAGATAVRAA